MPLSQLSGIPLCCARGQARSHRGRGIAHYKLPHDLRIVDTIPRNPSGKILKRTVREQLL
jgi:acyl-CoA synthetase (AMP-forming)/AMP-acid ligase II